MPGETAIWIYIVKSDLSVFVGKYPKQGMSHFGKADAFVKIKERDLNILGLQQSFQPKEENVCI